MDDEQTLAEFRQQACWEKLSFLAHRIVVTHRIAVRAHMALTMVAVEAELRTPTLQVTLPTRVFMNVANCLGIYHVAFSVLLCQGVLRRVGDTMEIWASKHDLKTEAIKTLISHANAFKMLVARGEFALRLPTEEGSACSTMRLNKNMTIEDLKGVASASTGIPTRRQRMTHLGSDLVSGRLVDSGVLPGSCIIVSEIIEC